MPFSGRDARTRLLEALLEQSPEGLLVADLDGTIVLTNRQAEELFGYPRDSLVGQPVDLLLPEAAREAHRTHRARYAEAPTRRAMGLGLELVGRRSDGSEISVDVSLSPLRLDGVDAPGDPARASTYVAAAIRDATPRRKMLDEAENARQGGQLEREALAFGRLNDTRQSTATAAIFGVTPLREAAPEVFGQIVERYGAALDQALRQQVYRGEPGVTGELREMAEQIGFLRGRPRDVIDLHVAAIEVRSRSAHPRKARAYAEEGRILLLELMGHLVLYYQRQAMGAST
ncbi:MAG TPA: PAS domain S-box protein [Candidatus Nanopelagicales bacterium]|nr:PAS domain S-box protein [Candidatus Nanopelagicales bacterium]